MGTKFRPSTKKLQSLIFNFPLCSKEIGVLKKLQPCKVGGVL
jgi:hypothetical protein